MNTKQWVEDAMIGSRLALLAALVVLSAGFDSTFIYRGF